MCSLAMAIGASTTVEPNSWSLGRRSPSSRGCSRWRCSISLMSGRPSASTVEAETFGLAFVVVGSDGRMSWPSRVVPKGSEFAWPGAARFGWQGSSKVTGYKTSVRPRSRCGCRPPATDRRDRSSKQAPRGAGVPRRQRLSRQQRHERTTTALVRSRPPAPGSHGRGSEARRSTRAGHVLGPWWGVALWGRERGRVVVSAPEDAG